jgi:tetratricopeptide (TPR) repeat protein
MSRTLLLTLLVLITPLQAYAQDVPEIARTLMEDAERAREAGRIDDAIDKYKKAIEAAPSLGSNYADLASLYYTKGKVDEAYRVLVRGLEKSPEDRTLLSNAAAAAQQLDKAAEALGYVDRALEKNKRDASLYSLRATILRALKRDDDALAALYTAVAISPDDAKIQFSFGNQLYAAGRKGEAIAAYRKAVELDKSLLRAQYNLGALLFEDGRFDEALQAYQMALAPIEQSLSKKEKVDPIHARAFANVGAILLRQQRYDEAAAAYRKALLLDPKNGNAHYNLGFILFTRNQFDLAAAEYRTALGFTPDLPLAYVHLAEIARRKGEYDKAIQLIREGLPRLDAQTKPAAMRTLGLAQAAKGDRAGAKDSLQQAVSLSKDDVTSRIVLSRLLRAEKRAADAKPFVEQALALAPRENAVLLESVLVARDANDAAGERAALDALLAVKPEVPLRRELIAVLLRQSAWDDALRAIDAAAQPDLANTRRSLQAVKDASSGKRDDAIKQLSGMTDPTSRGNLGLLLWTEGKESEAKPHLTAAHAAKPEWLEVAVAAGEVDQSAEILTAAVARCDNGSALCARAKQDLAIVLLTQAATETDRVAKRDANPRTARQLLDRGTALPLDARGKAAAMFLIGVLDLAAGNESSARESLSRAISAGLPQQAENAARANINAINAMLAAARESNDAPPADSPAPRRTAIVFLPDAPAENDKKLAETMTAILSQVGSAAGVPLQVEFFRRGDDARAFFSANRSRVGVVVSNPEFVSELGGDLTPRFQFARNGSTSYRRVVAVPEANGVKSMAELRGKTLSAIETLRDPAIEKQFTSVTRTPDDLAAAVNALYGKTDAALVSEANPLLARGLRVIHASSAVAMPVFAFAPMPEVDRTALTGALRNVGAREPLFTSLASIERERRPDPKPIEITTASASALGLHLSTEPPRNVPLRVEVTMAPVVINEEMFGTP